MKEEKGNGRSLKQLIKLPDIFIYCKDRGKDDRPQFSCPGNKKEPVTKDGFVKRWATKGKARHSFPGSPERTKQSNYSRLSGKGLSPALPRGWRLHRTQIMGYQSQHGAESLWRGITEPTVIYYLQPQHMPEMAFSVPKTWNRWSSSFLPIKCVHTHTYMYIHTHIYIHMDTPNLPHPVNIQGWPGLLQSSTGSTLVPTAQRQCGKRTQSRGQPGFTSLIRASSSVGCCTRVSSRPLCS